MADLKRTDLGFLGLEFQYRFIKALMEDNSLFRDLHSIIDQNTFTDPMLKVYVGTMKDYYEKNDSFPSYEMMQIALNDLAKTPIDKEMYEELNRKIKSTKADGSAEIKELGIRFFRQQNIIRAANKILAIAGDGSYERYDECVDLLQDALSRGASYDLGQKLFDELSDTLSDDYREPIPTGIEKLDAALNGGLGKGELGVVIGSSGFGKAQPLTARILTADGYKLMGDMKVGDEVIGRDGLPHKVTGVYPQGKRPIYKVTLSNGTSCECDIEHLWNVNSLYQRRGKKYIPGVSKSRDDKKTCPDFSFKTLTLAQIIKKGIIKNHGKRKDYNFKVPMPQPVHFNERSVPIDPYLIGYILGDGSIHDMTIAVGDDDKEAIQPMLEESASGYTSFRKCSGRNLWNARIIGEARKLAHSVLLEMKAADKEIPEDYLFNSIEKRTALLQGLMDTDGYANKNGSCEFCSKSKKLAEQVQFLVRSLGGFATMDIDPSGYKKKETGEFVDCGVRHRVCISMCDPNIQLFRLERKQSRVKYREKYAGNLFIASVEYVRDGEAQCIMVDSDEHLYLTEDFIVTHNTTFGTAVSNYASTYKCKKNLEQGYKVLQIVFEDSIKQIKRKHLSKITGVEACNLSKPEFIDGVIEKVKSYPDYDLMQQNLRIMKLPSGEVTATKIRELIKKHINTGFVPDLVILDYFECVDLGDISRGENEWKREGKVMRKFESMASDMNLALWVMLQGNRDSVNADVVTMDKSGGSFTKVQIAHIVLSIARTQEDIKRNKATLALLKNRAGSSGAVWVGVQFNNGTCTISTDDVEDYEDLFDYRKKKDMDDLELQTTIFKQIKKEEKAHGDF